MIEPVSPPPSASNAVPAKPLGLAMASLVLGICSIALVLNILTGIPAIVCGIIALNKISKSGGALRGRGQAIAGLVAGGVGCLLFPFIVMMAITLPALGQAREKAQRAMCASNEKQIALACLVYASNYGGVLPTSFEQLRGKEYLGYLGDSLSSVLRCPAAQDRVGQSYQLVGGGRNEKDIIDPAHTPLVVEDPANHHGAGSYVAYADAHVSWVPAQGGINGDAK